MAYCKQGGNIFVSGAFVGTDLWDNRLATADEADKKFAMEVLKYKWRVGQAATMGKVKSVASPFPALSGNYTYHNELNADSYVVESPDAIEPATKDAHTVMRYSENNLSAGVAYQATTRLVYWDSLLNPYVLILKRGTHECCTDILQRQQVISTNHHL